MNAIIAEAYFADGLPGFVPVSARCSPTSSFRARTRRRRRRRRFVPCGSAAPLRGRRRPHAVLRRWRFRRGQIRYVVYRRRLRRLDRLQKTFVLSLSNPYQIGFWLTVGVGLLEPGHLDVLAYAPAVGDLLEGHWSSRPDPRRSWSGSLRGSPSGSSPTRRAGLGGASRRRVCAGGRRTQRGRTGRIRTRVPRDGCGSTRVIRGHPPLSVESSLESSASPVDRFESVTSSHPVDSSQVDGPLQVSDPSPSVPDLSDRVSPGSSVRPDESVDHCEPLSVPSVRSLPVGSSLLVPSVRRRPS